MWHPKTKHALHCFLFGTLTIAIIASTSKQSETEPIDPWIEYGRVRTIVLYTLRFVPLLALPVMIFYVLGLICYNAFPGKVKLKGSPILAPFISFRVVTRGDCPDLVNTCVHKNLETCFTSGLENFLIEVVTDKTLNVQKHRRVREVVVPKQYQTKTGALFKARALQYCLEDDVNILSPHDWIVHLDEETILTEDCVRGIVNFVMDGKYPLGQGLITYASGDIVNWLTTFADCMRVSDDMGKVRFQLKTFHKPLFSWKGSFVVTQLHAERAVSFDNGPDGSIAEDGFFAMKAFAMGYSFDWIEGEMHEKSPFTIRDFVQQRRRWLQGLLLVVHSKVIPLRYKLFLLSTVYSSYTLPLSTTNIILALVHPLPSMQLMNFLFAFYTSICIYMFIFGVLKSFPLRRFGLIKSLVCIVASVCIIPLNIILENVAIIWALTTSKHRFYVVQKEILSKPTDDQIVSINI